MASKPKYRMVIREVIKPGMEEEMNRVFTEWVRPDLQAVLPDFMETAHVYRPSVGDTPNTIFFTAMVNDDQALNYGKFIRDAMSQGPSGSSVDEWYSRFESCLSRVDRLVLREVMTSDNPSIFDH